MKSLKSILKKIKYTEVKPEDKKSPDEVDDVDYSNIKLGKKPLEISKIQSFKAKGRRPKASWMPKNKSYNPKTTYSLISKKDATYSNYRKSLPKLWEEYLTSRKSPFDKSQLVDIYKNPSKSELRTIYNEKQNKNVLRSRVILHNNDAYAWNGDNALHWHVMNHLHDIGEIDSTKHIPLNLQHDKNFTYHAEVSDNFRQNKTHARSDVKNAVENHPWIKKHFTPDPDGHISYYDEDTEGPWHKQQKQNEEYLTESAVIPIKVYNKRVNIYHNPNHTVIKNLVNKHNIVRALHHNNELFVWPADEAIHAKVAQQLKHEHGYHEMYDRPSSNDYIYLAKEKENHHLMIDGHNKSIEHPSLKNFVKNNKTAVSYPDGMKEECILENATIPINVYNHKVDIYHNPDHKTIKNLVDKHVSVRALHHKNDLFVWNATDAIHKKVAHQLKHEHGYSDMYDKPSTNDIIFLSKENNHHHLMIDGNNNSENHPSLKSFIKHNKTTVDADHSSAYEFYEETLPKYKANVLNQHLKHDKKYHTAEMLGDKKTAKKEYKITMKDEDKIEALSKESIKEMYKKSDLPEIAKTHDTKAKKVIQGAYDKDTNKLDINKLGLSYSHSMLSKRAKNLIDILKTKAKKR